MNPRISRELRRYNYLVSELDNAYHDLSLHFGLSDSSTLVLYSICDSGDSCLLQDICRNSGVSKQTVNSALRRLEADGIIYLESAGAKNKRVCLTDFGKTFAEQTVVKLMEIENHIFASWSGEDVTNYLELTARYLHDFKSGSEPYLNHVQSGNQSYQEKKE